jgi:D-alanine-D-alanine ligase
MIRVGIFFGGQSREREVSFAGGRTVYDNLNKNLFEPVPIFVDTLGNFILLDWQYLYKGTIRDFYPPVESFKYKSISGFQYENSKFQIYIESLGELTPEEQNQILSRVGKKVSPDQFKSLFDFAFLTLHGAYGEDGSMQGILEWYNIPYTGCGILPSAIGVNKIVQSEILRNAGFNRPKQTILSQKRWFSEDKKAIFEEAKQQIGLPLVIKSPNQGSSIGVSVLREDNLEKFIAFVQKSFFFQDLHSADWRKLSEVEKDKFLVDFTDIREGLGFPVELNFAPNPTAPFQAGRMLIYHPQKLREMLDSLASADYPERFFRLTAEMPEDEVILEEYLAGKEFSCIVIQHEGGEPIALPPTEIRKFGDVFDYRGKYLPGTSRKVTPMEEDNETIARIRQECAKLFNTLHCNVYARIDGFLTAEGKIFLNDPNTTSGMMPSSFFFHQAAEIGLNASNFLTYIIRTSLVERNRLPKKNIYLPFMLKMLDSKIRDSKADTSRKVRVAVVMGGYSTERHISMESGRNIYEKLASGTKYAPFPVFLTGKEGEYELYILPVNLMLKDNADDIREKVKYYESRQKDEGAEIIQQIITEAKDITEKYAGTTLLKPQKISLAELKAKADTVFIALHGRPGEDGALQQELEILKLPYNGSGIASSQVTINKYETNETLRLQGVKVAEHALIYQQNWQTDRENVLVKIESHFQYPLIAKPADDGCSSAVKKIKNSEELTAFAEMMFRPQPEFLPKESEILKLKVNEEFPQKGYFLIEELIARKNAKLFMEITGGMLTHFTEKGEIRYEVFEPSETLALGDVLSLEEKFLAGEGQNITPAVYSVHLAENQRISQIVRTELEHVARILNIQGYCRIDAFVRVWDNDEIEVIIIEINSLPGMTPATCIFHQCALNGYKPYHFIDKILEFGRVRSKK